MSRSRAVAAGLACALLLGSAAAAASSGPLPAAPVTGATPHRVDVAVRTVSYAAFDSAGHRRAATWRISTAGGNCCETYVSALPNGRLVESGGTYPWYTSDEGRTWYEVRFDIPDQNDNGPTIAGGEGATVVGPGGDVYGVTWDAYSGDHLQAYRYTAQSDSWQVSDVVLKTPFYDRPWLTFAPGPFLLNGARTAQVLDVNGGGITKDIDTLSSDGLDYGTPSDSTSDESRAPTVKAQIPVVENAAADWWQPYPALGTLPLNAGGLLRFGNVDDLTGKQPCKVARLDPATSTWQCVTLPGTFAPGVVRQDSRGFLTDVHPANGGKGLAFATSRDGGLQWRSVTLRPPGPARTLEGSPPLYDVVANGRLGEAVVSARFDDAKGFGQDVVFRVNIRSRRPRLMQTYLVGRGDLNAFNDVTGLTADRMDFASVALLPDGRIAVSFMDSTCLSPSARNPNRHSPEVAVLAS